MKLIDLGIEGLEVHMGVMKPLDIPITATTEEIMAIEAENERRSRRVRFRMRRRLFPNSNVFEEISTYQDRDVLSEDDDYINYENDIPIQVLGTSISRWIQRTLDELYVDEDDVDVERWTPFLNQLANHLQDDYEVQEDGSLVRTGDSHASEVS